jgi:YidC/Oxa1 family membrane protein insertase
MDKNSIIGLSLIGIILATFTFLNKPTEEEIKAQQEKTKKELAIMESEITETDTLINNDKTATTDSISIKPEGENVLASIEKGKIIRLESEKHIFDFSTKGGILSAAYLKGYQSYSNYKKDPNNITPLKIFGTDDAINELVFPIDGKEFRTGNKEFKVIKKSKRGITFELKPSENQSIQLIYTLKPNAYDMDFEVKMSGFAGKVSPSNVMMNWTADLKKSEKLLSEQRRVSTICFKNKGKDYDYLSEMADDEEKMEGNLEWVAYKQSYFSTIMKPLSGFSKEGSTLKIKNFVEGDEKYHSHIKTYSSMLNLSLNNTGDASAKINWYFGPNDYETLKKYESNYEDIINYGWGLFRWINIYAIQPMFNVLANTGLGIGIVILLLTLIIKIFLTPIQWKMYVSSAKMRILKPEIETLNAKYPKKEDAMKKQMEMMTLYKESGASPLSGCIPMLIQMPILLAVFRFFPAAFELRQRAFLWADDLSSYDSVYDFGFYIWLYGDHISLFTLLMAITTLIYTWINSSNVQQPTQAGMPNMKVLMYIFPFMMIFFFNNYASGLSYYYFISTLISILIMIAIKQFFVDEEKLKAKMAAKKVANTNKGPKKKSKFQERLEQMQKMQKMQQEKLKGKK